MKPILCINKQNGPSGPECKLVYTNDVSNDTYHIPRPVLINNPKMNYEKWREIYRHDIHSILMYIIDSLSAIQNVSFSVGQDLYDHVGKYVYKNSKSSLNHFQRVLR
jgi:hypothetical protein